MLLVILCLPGSGCSSKKADTTKHAIDDILSDEEIESAQARQEEGQLVIDEVQLSHGGNYSCSVHNIHGSDSILYSLHVHCKIIIIISSLSLSIYLSVSRSNGGKY